jgi:hypothetical protein
MGDNACDSDTLDTELRVYGIEGIAPHRSNRRIKTNDVCGDTGDGGKLRDYLPGCRTSGASLSDMSATPKISSECFSLLAASFG